MSTLKRLFSPRALAATAGTALLAHTAIVAWAEGCYSTSAARWEFGAHCVKYCVYEDGIVDELEQGQTPKGNQLYWCCGLTSSCYSWQPGDPSPEEGWGWCCPL